jgi:autotransporter-associated beta strand protein
MLKPIRTVTSAIVFIAMYIPLVSDIVVTWDDGFFDFTDFSGTNLASNGVGNGNGDLVELGFYTEADDSNLFQGTWIPLTAGTRIGDSNDGTDLGDGYFSFSTSFDDASGDSTTYGSSSVQTIAITDGGSGYSSAPTVTITKASGDTTGSGATATANISGGVVTSITVTSGGTDYTIDPDISFSGGSPTTTATASADRYDFTDSNDMVRSVEVTSGGSGYTSNFDVSFTGGGGSGAVGEAIVSGGAITKIVIRDPGSGYTSLPTVDLSSGDGSGGAATADFLPQAGQLLALRFYDGTTNASGTLFNSVAATTSNWTDWPANDTDLPMPNLSVDTSNNSFLTDSYSLSQDLKTAVTDIDTAKTVTSFDGAVYMTGNYQGGTLTADISGSTSYTGIFADGDFENSDHGKLSLTKTNSGTLTLNGNANTYTGDTTVSAGGLTLSGSGTISNSQNIILASGTTLTVSGLSSTFALADGQTLRGEGSVSGDMNLTSSGNHTVGSAISPGGTTSTDYGIGELSITGATTWNAGTTYHWEINDFNGDAGDANADGLGWDHLSFTGALTFNGNTTDKILIDIAALDGFNSPYNQLGSLSGTQRPAANRTHSDGHSWAIITASGGITGFNADHFDIEYTHFYEQWDDPFHQFSLSQSGNSIYLHYSAVPEPSTYVMVSGLLVLPAITIYRRMKKKKKTDPQPTTENDPASPTDTL